MQQVTLAITGKWKWIDATIHSYANWNMLGFFRNFQKFHVIVKSAIKIINNYDEEMDILTRVEYKSWGSRSFVHNKIFLNPHKTLEVNKLQNKYLHSLSPVYWFNSGLGHMKCIMHWCNEKMFCFNECI